jgi:VanZ family protein
MPNSIRVTRWTLATIVWIGVILFSSTSAAGRWSEQVYLTFFRLVYAGANDGPYGRLHFFADKGFHVFLFLVLAILLWKAIPDAQWKIAAILLLGLLIGSCSEFLQSYFPDRDPAFQDVLINLGGTVAGAVLCLGVVKLPRRTSVSLD